MTHQPAKVTRLLRQLLSQEEQRISAHLFHFRPGPFTPDSLQINNLAKNSAQRLSGKSKPAVSEEEVSALGLVIY
jgi:hypothetical protein